MGFFKRILGRGKSSQREKSKSSEINKWYSLDSIKTISCGSFMLVPYDARWYTQVLDADSRLISLLGNSHRITDFLEVDFSSSAKVQDYLKKAMLSVEVGGGITYVLRQQSIPIGMIIVNTPTKNEVLIGFNEWTIDFFMLDRFENKGFMQSALPRILKVLKEDMHVDNVFFIVDPRNKPCLALLSKFPIDEIEHRIDNKVFYNKTDKTKARLFCCNLATIQFRHQ